MTDTATLDQPPLTHQQIDAVLQRTVDRFVQQLRAPVLRRPSDVGLDFEDVTFPAVDGVPLEGWFIPAPGSNRLVIANHPMGFSRSGLPAQLEPWSSQWRASGNDFEIDLLPDCRILHDAGYNVLAYDLRNAGLSGAANGGIASTGIFEARDVLGSLRYAREREDTRDMAVGLFSRCLGCSSTFSAMTRYPGAFTDVGCLVGAQPVTMEVIVGRRLALAGVPEDRIGDLEELLVRRTGIGYDLRTPRSWARSVQPPTLLYGVHDDILTVPEDLQAMFDAVPVVDKELRWIHGTTARWDGYLEFQRRPEPMLAWFDKHLDRS